MVPGTSSQVLDPTEHEDREAKPARLKQHRRQDQTMSQGNHLPKLSSRHSPLYSARANCFHGPTPCVRDMGTHPRVGSEAVDPKLVLGEGDIDFSSSSGEISALNLPKVGRVPFFATEKSRGFFGGRRVGFHLGVFLRRPPNR